AWVDLQPKGKLCGGSNKYGNNQAVMDYDSANDAVILIYHALDSRPEEKKHRGVYVYEPAANSWSGPIAPLPTEFRLCASGFYSPELNAHFIHCAGDSDDNGVMLVYRYKKAAEKK